MNLRHLFIFLSAFWLLSSCDRPRESYESRFHDTVVINFPPGHRFDESHKFAELIDAHLKENEIGFWSGSLGFDEAIESMDLDLDFKKIDPRDLIDSLKKDGLLPKDVQASW